MLFEYFDEGRDVLIDGEIGKCVLLSNREIILQLHDCFIHQHFIATLELLKDHFIVLNLRLPTEIVLLAKID